MKKYSELSKSLAKTKPVHESYTKYDRESFVRGNLVNVGDSVEVNGEISEVINVGPNYVTLIKEGKTFKSWITEIKKVSSSTPNHSIPTIHEGNISFKGFISKNIPQDSSTKIVECYSNTLDGYAFYNFVVATDSLLSANPNNLIECYYKYRNDFERVSKYMNKFGINIPKVSMIGEALDIVKEHKGLK